MNSSGRELISLTMRLVRHPSCFSDPRSNAGVRYLRTKIDRANERSLIETIRGAGYRFDPPDARGS